MFTWNAENVLCAIDAGIAEVISVYNSSYLFFLRQGEPLAKAHTLAMSHTLLWLRGIEDDITRDKLALIELAYDSELWARFELAQQPRSAAEYAMTRLA